MAIMMPAAQLDDILDNGFDDHPSVTASLEDFEEPQAERSPLLFDLPSQHSGFRSGREDLSDVDDRSSVGAPWSPPGFRRSNTSAIGGSGWFRHDPYSARRRLRPSQSPSRSRQTSPEYQDAMEGEDEDITLAANIPLPPGIDSPVKDRSPEPEIQTDDIMRDFSPEPPESPNNCTGLFLVHGPQMLTSLRYPLCHARRGTTPGAFCRLFQFPSS